MHGCDEPSCSKPPTENKTCVLLLIFRRLETKAGIVYRSRLGVGPSDRQETRFGILNGPRLTSRSSLRLKGRFFLQNRKFQERPIFSPGADVQASPFPSRIRFFSSIPMNVASCLLSCPRSFHFRPRRMYVGQRFDNPCVFLTLEPNACEPDNSLPMSIDRFQGSPPPLQCCTSLNGGTFRICTTRARQFPVFP